MGKDGRIRLMENECNKHEINDYVGLHIFEVSTKDFKTLLSYVKLRCVDNFPINYFDLKTYKQAIVEKLIRKYFAL